LSLLLLLLLSACYVQAQTWHILNRTDQTPLYLVMSLHTCPFFPEVPDHVLDLVQGSCSCPLYLGLILVYVSNGDFTGVLQQFVVVGILLSCCKVCNFQQLLRSANESFECSEKSLQKHVWEGKQCAW
jgi:hypothetical protein